MYFLTQVHVSVEGKEYEVYGIRFNDELYADDLSTEKNAVASLVNKCNENQLDPIHMFDVIDDFLA